MTRVAVFGTGSWGTAFAMILADAGCEVTLWARRAEVVDAVNNTRSNPEYLPGAELPSSVRATTDPAEAARGAEFTVLTIPSQTLRANLADWVRGCPGHRPRLADEGRRTGHREAHERGDRRGGQGAGRPGRRPHRTQPGRRDRRQAARRAVVACTDAAVANRLQAACHTPYFRPYTNTDVVGCELGGAVKNVIGLAVGIADGMGLGDNTKASLMTRGLAETTRLGLAMGADPHTFSGLAGMGDLIATCSSPLSRNHTFGTNLGRGMTLEQTIAASKQTAEGVKSCQSVLDLARRHDVDMPITETVVSIVHEGKPPLVAVKELMARSAKPERR